MIGYPGLEGDGSQHIPDFCEMIQESLEKREQVTPLSESGFGNMIYPEEFKNLGLPPKGDGAWTSLARLVLRPWFVRVWIIQEVALAQYVTLVCGG